MINKAESLAKTSKDLMLAEPFYGLFLIMLNKVWSDQVPTAGVSSNGINYQLTINEEFWESLGPLQHRGLLKHELLHIAFYHITDFNHLNDEDVANIAMDIEINQYIDPLHLPPGPQLISSYPELNLEPKKGTHYYYEKLMKGKQQGNCPNLNDMLATMVSNRQSNSGQQTIDLSGNPTQVPDHSTWKDFKDMDEATQKLLKAQAEHVIRSVADQVIKSRGTIPGELAEVLKKLDELEEEKFNWRAFLRRFAGGSNNVFTKKSRKKFNIRFEDNPGLKIKPKRRILVGVDTSGSVSTTELREFLNEINHIHKTGTEVMIIQCDSAISHIGKFDPSVDFEIHGRGGTSFHPVTDYYDENHKLYNCLIYLTDGEAPAPDKCKGPVLWVMSSQSKENPDLQGFQIKLN